MKDSTKSSDFKNLRVWIKALEVAKKIYELTRSFPDEEKFGLTSQIRRCAVSIPSNIAEGQARNSARQFIHFLQIAHGSAAELETQILICESIGLLDPKECENLISDIHHITGMIINLTSTLYTRLKAPT